MLLKLDDFISAVTQGSRAHVCVVDVSGISERDILSVNAMRKIHSSEFCSRAKLLHGGLRLCMRCRNKAKLKALNEKKPFFGKCAFGVGEVVYPVVSDGRVLCIVSIGLLCSDREELWEKAQRTAVMLKQRADSLIEVLPQMQPCSDFDVYMRLAQAIGAYILLLYNSTEAAPANTALHETVAAAIRYITASYYKEISIYDIADTYGLNAKYIGRLFKEQTGESFNTYLNRVRIHHAKQLLSGTRAQIIEIAFECGYNNVTYFNRIFKKLQGVTPSQYRQMHKKS